MESEPRAVAIGDFNADGLPDILANNLSSNVSVLLGNGDGTFQPPVQFAVGNHPFSIAIADVENVPDLVTADNGGGGVSLLSNGARF